MVQIEVDEIEPLSPRTWDAFADLAERHNGVWGGCWCTWFHLYPDPPQRRELGHGEFKRNSSSRAGRMRRWCRR
jgi:hypothetical protein